MAKDDAQPLDREVSQDLVKRHLYLMETVLRGPFNQWQIATGLAIGIELFQHRGCVKHVTQCIGKPAG